MNDPDTPHSDATSMLVVDRVYQQIKQGIIDGRYSPGQRLVQRALAEELGVSRAPVRDAVARLAQDGHVATLPFKGAVVRGLGSEQVLEIYDLREMLEPPAALRAATHATGADRAEVRDASKPPPEGLNQREAYQHSWRFHLALVRSAGNDTLTEVLDSLWQRSLSFNFFTIHGDVPGADEASNAEHQAIAEAFELGHGHEVAHLLREHLRHSRELIVGRLEIDAGGPGQRANNSPK